MPCCTADLSLSSLRKLSDRRRDDWRLDALWLDHQQHQPTGVAGTDVATRGGAREGCRRDKAWPRQAASTVAEEPQSATAEEA